jgi:putative oxidoreductase
MQANWEALGKLLLRLTVAGLILFHGISKLMHGLDPIAGMLEAKGLPPFMAYGAYVGEVVAPVFMIVGFKTRFAAAALAFNMVTAIGLAHAGDFFSMNAYGGWAVELPMFFLLGAMCVVLLGAGRLSLDARSSA